MAVLKISIDAKDVGADVAARAQRLTPAYKRIGEYLVAETDDRFARQRSPEGQPWAPLAAATQERKRKQGKIAKILQQDGALVREATAYQLSGEGVSLGANLPYAAIHQLGGRAGRGRSVSIPARPYLGVNSADEEEFGAIVTDYLLRG